MLKTGVNMERTRIRYDGSKLSGNYGHLGNPPNVGGSGGGGAGGLVAVVNGKTAAEVQKQYGLNPNSIIHAKQAICKVTGGNVKSVTNAQALYYIQNAKSKQNPGGTDKAQVIKDLQKDPANLQLNKPTPNVPAASTTVAQNSMPNNAPSQTTAQQAAVQQAQSQTSSSTQNQAQQNKAQQTQSQATTTPSAQPQQTQAQNQAMVSSINKQSAAAIQKQYGLNQNSIVHAKQAIAKELGVKTGDVTNAQALYYIQNAKSKTNPGGTNKAQVIKDLQQNPGSLNLAPAGGSPATPTAPSAPANTPTQTQVPATATQQAQAPAASQTAASTPAQSKTPEMITGDDGSTTWNDATYDKNAKRTAFMSKTVAETQAKLSGWAKKAFDKLPPSVQKGIVDYTDGSKRYNQGLRGWTWVVQQTGKFVGIDKINPDEIGIGQFAYGKFWQRGEMRKNIDYATKAIDSYELPHDVNVHRGAGFGAFEGMFGFNPRGMNEQDIMSRIQKSKNNRGDDSFVDGGFMSTTVNSGTQVNVPGNNNSDVNFNIFVPKGARAAYLNDVSRYKPPAKPYQDELLIQRGSAYRVTSVWKDKSGKLNVNMEVSEQIPKGCKLGSTCAESKLPNGKTFSNHLPTVAKNLGVSESTVRRYIKQYGSLSAAQTAIRNAQTP